MLLHKHNQETYIKMTEMFKSENRVCCVQPTGTGKSFLMLQLISDNQDKQFVICSPSAYIFSQIRTHAQNNNISIENCSFLTYSKVSAMTNEELFKVKADYIILDEFHRSGAVEWGEGINNLIATHSESKILGTSATPIRYLDSCRNMAEELFNNNYAVNMSLAEAIRRKILPLPIYVTSWYSFSGDIARLEMRAEKSDNPYFKRILHNKIQKAKSMIADLDCGLETIFERHMSNKRGKYIVFCADIDRLYKAYEESENWFRSVNSNVHKYKVFSGNSESDKQFDGFRNDNDSSALKLLFSVNIMLNEGVHVDGIDGVIMLRATQSANIFYQQLGRALSCSQGTKPVIFDIVNNYETGDTAKQYSEIMEIGRLYGSGEDYDIRFELYDYVRDIREILDGLKNSFEDSWDTVYEVLADYLAKCGRFPEYNEEFEGYKLGMWCSNQRVLRNAGNLSQERIDKLDRLEFIWDAKDEKWQNSFLMAKKFKDKYGRFLVRSDVTENSDVESVYTWLTQQRQIYKRGELSKERIEKLKSIDFLLEIKSNDEYWEENYGHLCRFAEENRRFPVTSDTHENEQIYKIYRWMLRQRKLYQTGELSQERIDKLNKIHFEWDRADALWNERFEILKKFISYNGRPPKAQEKYGTDTIGQWYNKQLKLYQQSKLDDLKKKKLESLDTPLIHQLDIATDKTWQKNYDLLKAYINENKHLPYSGERYSDFDLYTWLCVQKRKFADGNLDSGYIKKLAEIGIDIGSFSSVRDKTVKQQWLDSYNEYMDFLISRGHKSTYKEKKLYNWANIQRSRFNKGMLNSQQVEMLKKSNIINP